MKFFPDTEQNNNKKRALSLLKPGIATDGLQAQMQQLSRDTKSLFIVSICTSLLMAALYWSTPASGYLFAWLTLHLSLMAVRLRHNKTLANLSTSDWKRRFLGLQAIESISWCMAILIVHQFNTPEYQLIVYAASAAVLLYSAFTLSAYHPAFIYLYTPIALFIDGSTALTAEFGFGLSVSVYIVTPMLYVAAYQAYRLRRQNTRLKIENAQLFDSLESRVDERTTDLNQMNSQLSREVQLRKKFSDKLSQSEKRLTLAMEASQMGFWDWDLREGTIQHSQFGNFFDSEVIEAQSFSRYVKDLIHEDDLPQCRKTLVDHIRGKTDFYLMQYRIKDKAGDWHWIEDQGRAIERESSGRASRVLGTRRDITKERASNDQKQMAFTVFNNSPQGIFILNKDFTFAYVNDAFENITSFNRNEVINHRVDRQPRQYKTREETYDVILQAVLSKGEWQGELIEYKKSGSPYPQWLQIYAVYDDKQQISNFVGLINDLTARKEADEKLHYLTNYDQLTGLSNRDLFNLRFHSALQGAIDENQQLALIHIDIDRFRHINDSLGHEGADTVLKTVSNKLKDSLPQAHTLARFGGDEFMAVIEKPSDEHELTRIAENLVNSIHGVLNINNKEIPLSASIGICLYPNDGLDAKTLIHHTKSATLNAKHMGGNGYQFYNEDLARDSQERLSLEISLRKAILEQELDVYYQPKLDLQTGLITSAEALVRWKHPEKGYITPDVFIPLAEETGLISVIGEFVLSQACKQAKEWYDSGLGNIVVSVNLSAHQIRKGTLMQVVQDSLKLTQLPPQLLELEITESLLMENVDETIALLKSIQDLGIQISIDDFGTGYSSLGYLKKLPVDAVKIDRVFVTEVMENPQDKAIINTIITMMHSLGKKVIAEGVENEEQLDLLTDMGCDSIQGFYISKAIPDQEFVSVLNKQSYKSAGTPE